MPAETVITRFHLPVGVQLLCVYMDKDDIQRLLEDKEQLKGALGNIDQWRFENSNKVKQHFLYIYGWLNSVIANFMCIYCMLSILF